MSVREVLLTGGSGFIGRRLTHALKANQIRVRNLDLRRSDAAEVCYVGEIDDARLMANAAAGVDAILHLGAKHRFFGVEPSEFRRVNVEGTRNVIDAARQAGVRVIVFFSSVAVYGDCDGPSTESTACGPTSPYGQTKLEAERLLTVWAREAPHRRLVIVRPTVVFGPGNRGNVFRLMRQLDWHLYAHVGAGSNIKSVAYVDNLVAATLYLLGRDGGAVELFNYADEPHVPFRDFVALVCRALGRRPPLLRLPPSPLRVLAWPIERLAGLLGADLPLGAVIDKVTRPTHHSAQKLRNLGFQQPWTIEEGLVQMVAWYRGQDSEWTLHRR